MIFCLIGESSSGKSTIESRLEEMGFPRIISYTTRPPRDGEVDGVSYNFISEEKFIEMDMQGKFAETAQYREWKYALSLDGIDYINKDYIVVVTIHGYHEMIKAVGSENVKSIYIYVPERERIVRQLKRGDDVFEVFRRIKTDRVDFCDAELVCDYTITNDTLDRSLVKIYNIINSCKSAK